MLATGNLNVALTAHISHDFPLAVINSYLQCFDTVEWPTKSTAPTIAESEQL